MNNIHGQRINMDLLERAGSGYVARHAPDFLNFNDRWSQVLNLISDQDGAVYMIDWYDKNQCHHNNSDGHDRSNGRIYKITYGQNRGTSVDLQKKTGAQLVQLQLSKNDWHARHARRILQERGSNPQVVRDLEKIVGSDKDVVQQLRALWTLHVINGLTESTALAQLKAKSEYVRGWAIQLLLETKRPSDVVLSEMRRLAQADPSPLVRLYIAAALQRTPLTVRGPIIEALLGHGEDAQDQNLPLLYWYAIEPVAGKDPALALTWLAKSKIPLIRQYIARRVAAGDAIMSASN